MFESLSTRLQDVFKSLRGQGRLTPENIEAALREIRLALLEADVNFKVVKAFVDRVRDRAMDEAVLRSLSPLEQVVKIVRDEMLALVRNISASREVNVLVSSHLLPDIERTCDNVIVMRSGKIVRQGSMQDLRQTSGVQVEVEMYVETPPFVQELERQGVTMLNQTANLYRFGFPDDTKNAGKIIFESAKRVGGQVRGFKPATRSLEDIFLEAIE